MKKKFKEIALQVGGSHYPDVGGDLLEKFGEKIIEECIKTLENGDYRKVTYTTFDSSYNPKIVQECVRLINENFKE
jgi:methionyl-tRNA formyltransferase